jgi:hypothetical protein
VKWGIFGKGIKMVDLGLKMRILRKGGKVYGIGGYRGLKKG